MAITSTQTSNGGVANVAVGRYLDDGTVAAFTIECGFKPRYVLVCNVDSRDQAEFYEGMADDYSLKTVAAGTRTLETSLGITPTDNGFTMGLDLDVVVSNEQISWIAIG